MCFVCLFSWVQVHGVLVLWLCSIMLLLFVGVVLCVLCMIVCLFVLVFYDLLCVSDCVCVARGLYVLLSFVCFTVFVLCV